MIREGSNVMIVREQLAHVLESTLPDEEVVARIRSGEIALFEILMRRYNDRLFRVARSIVHDDREAEDIMQDTYVRAYKHLDQFKGQARFATWLTKIGVYEAMARARRQNRFVALDDVENKDLKRLESIARSSANPEDEVSNEELRALLEAAVTNLPDSHRSVFVLREVEGMSTAETAECLEISPESVRVRLHRARALLRQNIDRRLGEETRHLYSFHLSRCDRVVDNVFAMLESLAHTSLSG